MLCTLVVIISSFVGFACSSINSTYFTSNVLCNVQDSIAQGCVRQVNDTAVDGSMIKCMGLCARDEFCAGASLDNLGKCFLHKNCFLTDSCNVENTDHSFRGKVCIHGTWDDVTQTCTCVKGTNGPKCQFYIKTCSELTSLYGYGSGYYVVYVDPFENGKYPFLVTCHLHPSNFALVVVLKNSGVLGFNRTWEEYMNGFRIDDDNYWAGLVLWYEVCKVECPHISLKIIMDDGSSQAWRIFRGWQMLNESGSFQITFTHTESGKFGNINDVGACLESLKNIPFSAWDKDSDGDPGTNCAARSGSGWWYPADCANPCNVLGLGSAFRATRPLYELMSVVGVDIETHASRVDYVDIQVIT